MKALDHFILSEKDKNRKCMDCTWFKTDPNDLPDFGKCIINHCDAISSDRACADFAYPKGGKRNYRKGAKFMKGKASDICPMCKHCDCKNCKAVTRVHDGETASIRIIEVECVDPYDGMVKTLDADSDICCSMFEPKPACEKCERFDGTYCHSPEGIFVTSYMATGNCSFYSEKKEKEPFNLNMPREAIKAIAKLNNIISELEKEKAAHMKGIERLKKSQEKLQVKLNDADKENTRLCNENTELRNKIVDLMKFEDGNNDILAKDIEIKSLQDKYEAAMAGWKDAIDTNDKMIGEKDKQIEELTRRYNMIAKKLNDIHDILKEDPNNA